MKKSTSEKRERETTRRLLAQASDLAWESYRSHLADTVKCKEIGANERWHASCCLDYAHIIYACAAAAHALTKLDFPLKVETRSDKI